MKTKSFYFLFLFNKQARELLAQLTPKKKCSYGTEYFLPSGIPYENLYL
jgi:hypothetical protein